MHDIYHDVISVQTNKTKYRQTSNTRKNDDGGRGEGQPWGQPHHLWLGGPDEWYRGLLPQLARLTATPIDSCVQVAEDCRRCGARAAEDHLRPS